MSDNFETSTRMLTFRNFPSYFSLFFRFTLYQLHVHLKDSLSAVVKKTYQVDVNQNPSSATTLIDTRAMTQFDELFKGRSLVYCRAQTTD